MLAFRVDPRCPQLQQILRVRIIPVLGDFEFADVVIIRIHGTRGLSRISKNGRLLDNNLVTISGYYTGSFMLPHLNLGNR